MAAQADSSYNYFIEDNRAREFPHLKNAVYLDHAGATLLSKKQIDAVHQDLSSNLYGNPHSHNASSKLATDTVDQIRYRLLKFFNTSHDEYSLIFTSGCTGSLKIIADCFNFTTGQKCAENCGIFSYLDDNHTSVQGMREVVADKCSGIFCVDEDELKVSLSQHGGPSLCSGPAASSPVDPVRTSARSLFVYPAQSNFSGRKYPLDWITRVQNTGLYIPGRRSPPSSSSEKWFVVLDAAAFVSTSSLDLSQIKPDFVTVSFYKIFGYPTGLGALLVHKRAWDTMSKTYFAGGTVAMSTARERFHVLRETFHEKFEDGTIPFLSIISLRHGLEVMRQLAGGMEKVSRHVFAVGQYFHHNLRELKHGSGQSLAEIYGNVQFDSPEEQGGIVTFNLKRGDGKYIGFAEVDKFAQLHDVHLRTGCFCNIGACQRYLHLSSQLIKDNFAAGHVCGDNMDLINGLPTGAVRVSFGYMSTIQDARVCLRFIADSFLEQPKPVPTFPDPHWYRSCAGDAVGIQGSAGIHRSNMYREGGIMSGVTGHVSDNKIITAVSDNKIITAVSDNKIITAVSDNKIITAVSVSNTCSDTVKKVTDIFLYPIKSCGAFRASEWEMCSKGLLYDREWVLVSDTGVTIGQKREPRICLLSPAIDLIRKKLILSFPGASSFELPLDQENDSDVTAGLCTNKVCGDRVNTNDCGDAVSDWLSEIFECSGMRLLRQQSEDTRTSKLPDKENVGPEDPEKPRLSMANESQLLLLSRASVRELQKKMVESDFQDAEDSRVPTAPANITEDNLVLRFRGNLIIDGGASFEEEGWTSIKVGDNTVVCQGICSRCQMICMDQETGQKSREPLRTLGVWRGKKVPFGVHARMLPPEDGSRQIICVGDLVLIK